MAEQAKFARCCDITGKGMNSGYYIECGERDPNNTDNVIHYVSSKELMDKLLDDCGYNRVNEYATINTDEEWFYYTEWEELDEDEHFLEDGTRIETEN